MPYYDALAAKWATLAGTTEEKLAAINALTVDGPKIDVPISAVVAYLALGGKLAALQTYAAAPPANADAQAVIAARELVALVASPNAPAFRMSQATVYATVEAFLAALAGDAASGVTADDESALLALAATTIPWWRSAGYSAPIGTGDLDAAGGLA